MNDRSVRFVKRMNEIGIRVAPHRRRSLEGLGGAHNSVTIIHDPDRNLDDSRITARSGNDLEGSYGRGHQIVDRNTVARLPYPAETFAVDECFNKALLYDVGQVVVPLRPRQILD